MTLVVPNVGEVDALEKYLNEVLTLKLYSNNVIPGETSTAASFTEVVGGGYLAKSLLFANWDIVAGAPSSAIYDTTQDFNFTGVTNAPGTIYGYFVVNSLGVCKWAERFPAAVVPFTPVLGSLIRFIPQFQAS